MNDNSSIMYRLKLNRTGSLLILKKPDSFHSFDDIPFDAAPQKESYDGIVIFITSPEDIAVHLKEICEGKQLNRNGLVYFAYIRKGRGHNPNYIERNDITDMLHMDDNGSCDDSKLVFAAMVSIDDIYSVIGFKNGFTPQRRPREQQRSRRR